MEETGDRQLLNLFIRDVMKIPLMTREKEALVARKAVAGDVTARNRLVTANLRFVLTLAFRYRGSGVPLIDLVSAGCMGILIAAEKYDPDVGVRFITYAGHWIRERMWSLITGDKDPYIVSLDDPVRGDEEITLKDLLPDDDRSFENALGEFDVDRLLEHPGVLTERERRCLRLRYRDDMTLRQAGAFLGVDKTRVATIETRALYKLRRFLACSGTSEEKTSLQRRLGLTSPVEERAQCPNGHR
ncbi:MAG: sigma-70 family RNA polymerase sigma factor [Syntrophorhabdaceae bacterium]|nr:sigma-70 family RNA polymerase sigma factor [Syntrophorhabdaceae bacterium]